MLLDTFGDRNMEKLVLSLKLVYFRELTNFKNIKSL